MRKITKTSIIGLLIIAGLVYTVLATQNASAFSILDLTPFKPDNTPDSLPDVIAKIINVLLYLLGAISVVMLVWGGVRYTTSGGNSTSVTAAKNTIMYAIIGLVVAILAYAIVNFVIGALIG